MLTVNENTAFTPDKCGDIMLPSCEPDEMYNLLVSV